MRYLSLRFYDIAEDSNGESEGGSESVSEYLNEGRGQPVGLHGSGQY